MTAASATEGPRGPALGTPDAHTLAWERAERPIHEVQRPGARSRRLIVGAYLAFVISGLLSMSATAGASSRRVADEGIGSVGVKGVTFSSDVVGIEGSGPTMIVAVPAAPTTAPTD